jgi:hypothetical protein
MRCWWMDVRYVLNSYVIPVYYQSFFCTLRRKFASKDLDCHIGEH